MSEVKESCDPAKRCRVTLACVPMIKARCNVTMMRERWPSRGGEAGSSMRIGG